MDSVMNKTRLAEKWYRDTFKKEIRLKNKRHNKQEKSWKKEEN